jgi:hypothetical protein
MKLDQFATMRAFETVRVSSNTGFIDHLLSGDQADEMREKFLTKRLQFDTHELLFSEVEKVCSMLSCSKREFLEMAVSEAVQKAQLAFEQAFKAAGGVEYLEVEAC